MCTKKKLMSEIENINREILELTALMHIQIVSNKETIKPTFYHNKSLPQILLPHKNP